MLRDLTLPNLNRLLAMLTPTGRDDAAASTFTPPHERALASAWGWHGSDGCRPFAAHEAASDGIDVTGKAWGMLTPVHWQLGRDHVLMADPAHLELAKDESRALFDSVRGLFESEGFTLAFGAATRWYIARDDLDALPTASLDRVIGRNVDAWLGGHATAIGRLVRRLQSEVQLVFHTHPVNEAREERDALAVNSFWLSGCGRPQPVDAAASPKVVASLRAPWLAADWAAWADAWHALDASAIAALVADATRGMAVALTLCGERSSARFEQRPRPWWQRLGARWRGAEAHLLLEGL